MNILLDPTIARFGDCFRCGEPILRDRDLHICEYCHERFCGEHVEEVDMADGTVDLCEKCRETGRPSERKLTLADCVSMGATIIRLPKESVAKKEAA